MKGLWELCWEVFRGYFLWFSEISLLEKAAAGDFCGALVNFWSYSRAEYVRMRVTWNVYYLAVVVTVVAVARQWENTTEGELSSRPQSKEDKKTR